MPKITAQEGIRVIPRNYCLCYEKDGTKYYFAPATHVTGNALRTSPDILGRRIQGGQRYKRWHWEKLQRGETYVPKFPWPEELLEEQDIAELLRDSINKREGRLTLFDAYPGEALKNLAIRGEVLTAKVKSKQSRKETIPTYYECMLKSAFLDNFGNFDLIEMDCKCPDHGHDLEKGGKYRTIMECAHLSAMEQEFQERVYCPNPRKNPITVKSRDVVRRGVKRGLFSPFTFAANWVLHNGRIVPRNKHLAALEEDVKATYYILGENYFDINRRLLSIPEVHSPAMLDAIRRGEVFREVVQQKRKKSETKTSTRNERMTFEQFDRFLRKFGYRMNGYYLELGRPAIRYENANNVVGFIPDGMFYVVRKKGGGEVRPFDEDGGEQNPFKLLGKRGQVRYDDRTMVWTPFSIQLPSAFRIPESPDPRKIKLKIPNPIKNRWRREIEKANPGISDSRKKYARLYY